MGCRPSPNEEQDAEDLVLREDICECLLLLRPLSREPLLLDLLCFLLLEPLSRLEEHLEPLRDDFDKTSMFSADKLAELCTEAPVLAALGGGFAKLAETGGDWAGLQNVKSPG